MKNTPIAFLILVVLGVGSGLISIYSGSHNVAANENLEGLTRWVLGTSAPRSVHTLPLVERYLHPHACY